MIQNYENAEQLSQAHGMEQSVIELLRDESVKWAIKLETHTYKKNCTFLI